MRFFLWVRVLGERGGVKGGFGVRFFEDCVFFFGEGRCVFFLRKGVCLCLTIHASLHLYIHVQMMTELHLSHHRCHIHVCAQAHCLVRA